MILIHVSLPSLQMGSKPDVKTKLKFTSFFKSVVVELDKEAYGPDNHLAEWHRKANSEDSDGFTVSLTPSGASDMAPKAHGFAGVFSR